MRSSLSPLSSTRLHRVVCVTGHPRDKFAMENIHGYVKRKKKPPLTFNLVNSWVFRYQGKRANQVSLFDTNMKPQKYCFSSGFFRAVERMIDVDIYGRIHVLTFYVSVKSKLQHAPPGNPPGI